jgi:Neprosin
MNEDGHVSIPRRGYIAAGLAAAVVGSLGVFSTLNAGADEVSEAPAAVAAVTTPDGETPPPVLPWGAKPQPVTKAAAGASSKTVAAVGADIAPDDKSGSLVPKAEFGPKGYTSKARTLRRSRTTVAPQPPLAEPVPGTREVKYHYASAFQYADSGGTYANLVIGKPYLAKEDYHTLAEIAVQSADGRQIVEVGWTVDRGVNGDEDPHLFVYHWVDGKETCYNACGFRQYSKAAIAGDTLPVGVAKRFGIQYFNGAWWIAYDSEWVGYFPDSLWTTTFNRSGLIQWFGEVASSSSKPCSGMGTGVLSPDPAAARIGTIALLDGPDPAFTARATSPDSTSGVYPVNPLSDRTFRYGGPGAC